MSATALGILGHGSVPRKRLPFSEIDFLKIVFFLLGPAGSWLLHVESLIFIIACRIFSCCMGDYYYYFFLDEAWKVLVMVCGI